MKTQKAIRIRLAESTISDFQDIVRILTNYDDVTGRYLSFPDRISHQARKRVAMAEPNNVRVRVTDLGNFVYEVIATVRLDSSKITARWVHEDGIRLERGMQVMSPAHPVHSIKCLTDLVLISEGKTHEEILDQIHGNA